jgi:hypothetical protein
MLAGSHIRPQHPTVPYPVASIHDNIAFRIDPVSLV